MTFEEYWDTCPTQTGFMTTAKAAWDAAYREGYLASSDLGKQLIEAAIQAEREKPVPDVEAYESKKAELEAENNRLREVLKIIATAKDTCADIASKALKQRGE